MGLFSTVKFFYPLPLPVDLGELKPQELQSTSYQTKDLENCLDYYEVDKDGQLFREERESEYIPGNPKGKTFSDRFGYIKTLKSWLEKQSDTCTVNFYEAFQDDANQNDYWIDYLAEFVGGKLTSVRILKFEKTPNAERKIRDAKWKAEMAASYEFRKLWYIKHLYLPYVSVIRFIFRKYNDLLMKLPSQWKVQNFLTPW